MKNKVISATFCAGKSTLCEKYKNCIDSDSSNYHDKDENGNRTFKPYLDAIEKAYNDNKVIFVSAHPDVRQGLQDRGIDYIYVAHESSKLDEVLKLNSNRETKVSNEIIKSLWDNANKAINDKEEVILLKENQFLGDLDIVKELLKKED